MSISSIVALFSTLETGVFFPQVHDCYAQLCSITLTPMPMILRHILYIWMICMYTRVHGSGQKYGP